MLVLRLIFLYFWEVHGEGLGCQWTTKFVNEKAVHFLWILDGKMLEKWSQKGGQIHEKSTQNEVRK